MIPIIGIMVGAYIITRMVDILVKKDTQNVVAIFAVVTILVVLFSILSLYGLSSSIPSSLQ